MEFSCLDDHQSKESASFQWLFDMVRAPHRFVVLTDTPCECGSTPRLSVDDLAPA